jgi:hypothetical protein
VRILHKGVRTEKDPIGELSETVIYFQTELNGIKLTKSVNWFEKSNLDSLRSVLNRLDSDTSNIGKKDYDLIKKGFNRLRRQ